MAQAICVENGVDEKMRELPHFEELSAEEYGLDAVASVSGGRDIVSVASYVLKNVEMSLGEVEYFQR